MWKNFSWEKCSWFSTIHEIFLTSNYFRTMVLSLSMLVLNSRDQQGKLCIAFLKCGLNKELYNMEFATNTSHESTGVNLLTLQIYSNNLNMLRNWSCQLLTTRVLSYCLTKTIDQLPKPLGLWHPFFLRLELIFIRTNISIFCAVNFHLH